MLFGVCCTCWCKVSVCVGGCPAVVTAILHYNSADYERKILYRNGLYVSANVKICFMFATTAMFAALTHLCSL